MSQIPFLVLQSITIPLGIIGAIGISVTWYMAYQALKVFSEKYPEDWKKLGGDLGLFWAAGNAGRFYFGNAGKFRPFLFSKNDNQYPDPVFQKWQRRYRISFILGYMYLLGAFAFFMFAFYIYQTSN